MKRRAQKRRENRLQNNGMTFLMKNAILKQYDYKEMLGEIGNGYKNRIRNNTEKREFRRQETGRPQYVRTEHIPECLSAEKKRR